MMCTKVSRNHGILKENTLGHVLCQNILCVDFNSFEKKERPRTAVAVGGRSEHPMGTCLGGGGREHGRLVPSGTRRPPSMLDANDRASASVWALITVDLRSPERAIAHRCGVAQAWGQVEDLCASLRLRRTWRLRGCIVVTDHGSRMPLFQLTAQTSEPPLFH